MSNNKAIQILRTDKISNTNKDVELLDGQPFYNKQKNYLTIGKSTFDGDEETKSEVTKKPITVREVIGYFGDSDGITGDDTGDKYELSPNNDALELSSSRGLNLQANTAITADANSITETSPIITLQTASSTPATYIKLEKNASIDAGDQGKIEIVSDNKIDIQAPSLNLTGSTTINGNISNVTGTSNFTGSVTITKDTSASDSDGALKVTGGVKAKNLYVASTDATNTISGTTNTISGTTNIIKYNDDTKLSIDENGVSVNAAGNVEVNAGSTNNIVLSSDTVVSSNLEVMKNLYITNDMDDSANHANSMSINTQHKLIEDKYHRYWGELSHEYRININTKELTVGTDTIVPLGTCDIGSNQSRFYSVYASKVDGYNIKSSDLRIISNSSNKLTTWLDTSGTTLCPNSMSSANWKTPLERLETSSSNDWMNSCKGFHPFELSDMYYDSQLGRKGIAFSSSTATNNVGDGNYFGEAQALWITNTNELTDNVVQYQTRDSNRQCSVVYTLIHDKGGQTINGNIIVTNEVVATSFKNNDSSFKVDSSGQVDASNINSSGALNAVYDSTTKLYKFKVDSDAKVTASSFETSATGTNKITLSNNGEVTANSFKNTSESFSVNSSGEVKANTYNATSDKRLKANIKEYRPEKSILNLPVYEFDYINGPKNQIGCMAQDLQEICPQIVNENENGYLSIQESKIIYLLLEEVKQLRDKVSKLEEEQQG